ncbi:DUF4397 domain-containing protein [Carboxylicivirga mesophila]|uniref:DUF4397 domain-containing protein n=1 Tax=Carboxylicivirga mesophila TaxID=1166478 RepID=A0ABS5KC73_9BACT|nr:DUF4397 domain-containing protein [Carboxylicivirga mesophila]MBS2212639.1 DUF4397 domain-containing protein [Carboxylicivirga mesophila]
MKKILTILIIGLFIASCGSDKTSDPKPEPVMEQAELTAFNFLPVAYGLDWHVNNETFKSNQAYGNGSGATVEWEKGSNSLKLEVKNTENKTTVITDNHSFVDQKEYIGVVFGTSGEPELEVLEKDMTPPASGKVRVRFFNALDSAGAIDIYLGGETADYKKVSNLAYKASTAYMDVEVSALSGLVVYTSTGVLPDDQTDILRYSGNQSSAADKIYTHLLAPKLDDFSKAGIFILNH